MQKNPIFNVFTFLPNQADIYTIYMFTVPSYKLPF